MKVSIQNNNNRLLIKAVDTFFNVYSTVITKNDDFVVNFCNKDLNIFEKLIQKYELEENDGYYNFNIIEPIFLTYKLKKQEKTEENTSKIFLNQIHELQEENKMLNEKIKIMNEEKEKKNKIIQNLNYQINILENKFKQKILNGEINGFLSDYVMINGKIVNKNLKLCKITFSGLSNGHLNLSFDILFQGVDNTASKLTSTNLGHPGTNTDEIKNNIKLIIVKNIDLFENIDVLIIETGYIRGNMHSYYSFIRRDLLPDIKLNTNIKSFSFKVEGSQKEKQFKSVSEIEDYLDRVGPIFQ